MRPKTRIALVIAIVVLAVAAAGGGYLWWRYSTAPKPVSQQVVVVFAMPGEDQAVVAQLVVTVDTVSGTYKVADPNADVPVPGTSYTHLRDAYPFGGAQLVASALLGKAAARAGWVDVSPEAWKRLLAGGFDVDLTEGFQAYDEKTDVYSQFEVGPQHVAAGDLQGFVNGLPYTAASARTSGFAQLAAASLRALEGAQPGEGVATNLTQGQWADLTRTLANVLVK